jgi:phosphoribosylcarboxyaminoimidazole (NCAIR) mutase
MIPSNVGILLSSVEHQDLARSCADMLSSLGVSNETVVVRLRDCHDFLCAEGARFTVFIAIGDPVLPFYLAQATLAPVLAVPVGPALLFWPNIPFAVFFPAAEGVVHAAFFAAVILAPQNPVIQTLLQSHRDREERQQRGT